VQRRRADITRYLDASTDFPEREAVEDTYSLSEPYRRLFNRVLRYAREIVEQPGEGYRRRMRWWSALALLRSMASSPAAAASTLRSRAATTEADNETDVDDIGRRTVLDLLTGESAEGMDVVPGSDVSAIESLADDAARHRRRLRGMANEADRLSGTADQKLQGLIPILKKLLKDGYSPIVFCRFIPTVEYLQEALRAALPRIDISGVTGMLPPAEREHRVAQLIESEKRVLVCTDCLSEGINLQQGYDAVVHYDLSWNPTRHEQRDGRVDRYGQPRERVKIVTYYGIDNQIDGVVLDVQLRKHESIRNSLGISVPVPDKSEDVVEAILQGLLMREDADIRQRALPGFEVALRWEAAAERDIQSRTMFAQRAISVDEVAEELRAARRAFGSNAIVQSFTQDAVLMHDGTVTENGVFKFDLSESPRGLRDMLGQTAFVASNGQARNSGVELLTRTHPIVEKVANYVMNTAPDSAQMENGERLAKRLASLRTGEEEPALPALQTAKRDVISNCIYGVDINPMAAELCKISLWLEALDPGKPLSFLDHQIQVGNSLLGTTPKLMAEGIPNEAFKAIKGDDKTTASALCKQNRGELKQRKADVRQMGLEQAPAADYRFLSSTVSDLAKSADDNLSDFQAKEELYAELANSPEYMIARLLADAWCAAFVWEKSRPYSPPSPGPFPTRREGEKRVPPSFWGRVDTDPPGRDLGWGRARP